MTHDPLLSIDFAAPSMLLREMHRASTFPIVGNGPPGTFVLFPGGLRVSLPTDQIAILGEYRSNLSPFGQPRPGNAFLKWLMTNQYDPGKVTHVPLTPRAGASNDFEELPPPPNGVRYDPSDRKFLAVSAAHPERPPVLQALDSKWWGWTDALKTCGVAIHFLCPDAIAAKYREKLDP